MPAAHRFATLCTLLVAPLLTAQQSEEKKPQPKVAIATGTVTGRVLCQDTQKPAHGASITLMSAATDGHQAGANGQIIATTDFNGNYTMDHVPAGDYTASAIMPGYVPQREATLATADTTNTDKPNAPPADPTVHVEANHTVRLDLTTYRGATVTGRVTYDDGSPAAGVNVTISAAGPQPSRDPFQRRTGITDDTGAFRLSGLATGKYRVSTAVVTSSVMHMAPRDDDDPPMPDYSRPPQQLRVFAPGVFHSSEASTFDLRLGEVHTDTNIIIPTNGVHHVSGHLTLSDPSLGLTTQVNLEDADHARIMAVADPRGNYDFVSVPKGTYKLHIPTQQYQNYSNRDDDEAPAPYHLIDPDLTVAVEDSDVTLNDILVTITPPQPKP